MDRRTYRANSQAIPSEHDVRVSSNLGLVNRGPMSDWLTLIESAVVTVLSIESHLPAYMYGKNARMVRARELNSASLSRG
jgi:hypothetical protein